MPRCAARAFEQCSDDAAADLNLAVDAGLLIAEQPYDNAQCSGRFVYEVDTEDYASALAEHDPERGRPLWLLNVWDITQIETPEECSEVVLDLAIRRELASSGWHDWADFRVIGDWRDDVSACETVMCGQYPDGSVNDTKGAPHSWVDVEGTRRVRVALSAHDAACNQYDVMFAAQSQP